jgi:glycerophosphoryl diester phosphodiesterase
VVVISHDPNTKRCFGVDFDVKQTPYNGMMDQLRTQDAFKERMPTFEEVAKLFATNKDYADVKIMLDVKRTNEAWVIPKVVDILRQINPDLKGFWANKIILGLWRWDVLQVASACCSELPVMFIGVEQRLARRFLREPQVTGISLVYMAFALPGGTGLIDEARRVGKSVWSWTINTPQTMEWAVSSNLDGVITDFPDKYNAYVTSLERKDTDQPVAARPASFTWSQVLRFRVTLFIIRLYFRYLDFKIFFWPRPPL